MKLIHIVGCRPNFMKLAPVYEAAKKKGAGQIIIHTGQHYDDGMSGAFFKEFKLPEPDKTFDINKGLPHGRQTAEMLHKIEQGLFKHKPENSIIVVYGDTNSALAGALAAKKMGFRIAHVEAGIRSWDESMPEEINRKLVDEISNYKFCPSGQAVCNLGGNAINTGDVTYDQFLRAQDKLKPKETTDDYIFVTIHRENNSSGHRLSEITTALEKLFYDKRKVVWPVHPRIKKVLGAKGGGNCYVSFQTTDPITYYETLDLIKHAQCVVTDSGGIQKEAFWSGVPCVTVRNSTEWPELVRAGWNILVEPEGILDAVETRGIGIHMENPYGDGRAAERIVNLLSLVGGDGSN